MQRSFISLCLSLSILLLASCVQPASDIVAPVQVGSNATWTVTPSETPIVETDTPTPTTEVEALSEDIVTPTETATATATETPTPTEAQSALIEDAPLQDDTVPIPGNQDQPPPAGEFELTATAIVAGATATESAVQTATALALGIGITNTPTPAEPIVVTTAPEVPGNILPGADCIHEVRAADRSLYRLSLAYGVPVMDIAAASGILNPDLIRVGQRLTIPGCGTTGGRPPATSTPGPNTGTGTGGTGTIPPNGDCSWGTSVIFPSGCTTAGTGGTTGGTTGGSIGTGGPVATRTHVVRQGETLFEISLLYGVDVASIAALNGISNYDYIVLNQELLIP